MYLLVWNISLKELIHFIYPSLWFYLPCLKYILKGIDTFILEPLLRSLARLKYILKGIDTPYRHPPACHLRVWNISLKELIHDNPTITSQMNGGLKYILKGIDTHSLKPGNQSLDIVWNISLKELILKWRFRL